MSRHQRQNRKDSPKVKAGELMGMLTGSVVDLRAHANALYGCTDPLLDSIIFAGCFRGQCISIDAPPVSAGDVKLEEAGERMAELMSQCATAVTRLDDKFFDRVADLIRRVRAVREGRFADPLGFHLILSYCEVALTLSLKKEDREPTFREHMDECDARSRDQHGAVWNEHSYDEKGLRRICVQDLGLEYSKDKPGPRKRS